ncbi:MAG: hypothetical protein NXI22_18200 [bacterium]|nr:hypothetical protein [bacterium]
MAGADIENGADNSRTLISPAINRCIMSLRVGSESAKKVSSSWADRELTIWLTVYYFRLIDQPLFGHDQQNSVSIICTSSSGEAIDDGSA